MTSNKNRKAEIRRVGEALGLKYTEATRAVAMQEAGLLPKLPPALEVIPGEYDPLHDAVRAFIAAVPSGEDVLVQTAPLVALISELGWNLAPVEPDLPEALDELLGLETSFAWDADLNPVDREVAGRLLDLCAALAGQRLDALADYMFQGRYTSSLLKALVEAGGALIAALGARPAGDPEAVAAALRDRLAQLRTGPASG